MVPTVCVLTRLEPTPGDDDAETSGGIGDWTTLKDGEPESGGSGRKILTGTFRNDCDGGGRRILEMRWKEGRSAVPRG